MPWQHSYQHGPGIAAAVFGLLVIVALVIGVTVWMRRSRTNPRPPAHHATTSARVSVLPEHVLAERFARGEIDETEYERRLTALRAHEKP